MPTNTTLQDCIENAKKAFYLDDSFCIESGLDELEDFINEQIRLAFIAGAKAAIKATTIEKEAIVNCSPDDDRVIALEKGGMIGFNTAVEEMESQGDDFISTLTTKENG